MSSEASELAAQYLTAVAGGSEDRGWSLLHPDARRDMFRDNVAYYLGLVRESDWESFRWAIESVAADDAGLYLVRLRTFDPPAFLVEPAGANLRMISPSGNGTATMAVRVAIGSTGIWPAGG